MIRTQTILSKMKKFVTLKRPLPAFEMIKSKWKRKKMNNLKKLNIGRVKQQTWNLREIFCSNKFWNLKDKINS
jgi:hypothetical protein